MRKPGFLVHCDTWFPGWSAAVDGGPAPLLLANRAMRAVPLSAGEHLVEMRFASTPFLIGATVSALGWLAVLTFGVRSIALRRRSVSPGW